MSLETAMSESIRSHELIKMRNAPEGGLPPDAFAEKVHHPAHYNQGNIECIHAIAAAGHAEGFCIGNCLKYLWRYQLKNGEEDLAKAQFYLNWYVDYLKTSKSE